MKGVCRELGSAWGCLGGAWCCFLIEPSLCPLQEGFVIPDEGAPQEEQEEY